MTKEKELTFEEAMSALDHIVEKLEEGDVPLEKAISYYEEGMKLSKLCNDKLKNAQEKMTNIINEQDVIEPFEVQEE